MGNKFPIISVLMLVVCLPAAIYLSSSKIEPVRKEMYKGREKQLEMVYLPVCGVDKFYADAQWVQLIQEMAKQNTSSSDPKNAKKLTEEEEKAQRAKQAKYFAEQFDRLSDLDPNNTQYYLFGARFLQNDLPNDAISLLAKGDKLLKDPSWDFPQLQYHIIRNIIVGQDQKAEKANLDKMSALLEEAKNRPNAPAHIQTKWLQLQAQKRGYDNDDVGKLKLWTMYYLDKVKRSAGSEAGGAENVGSVGGYETNIDAELRNMIIQMAQRMALEKWQLQQKEANPQEKAKLAKMHKEISDAFFKVAPAGHYSEASLLPYEAGDLYDTATGTPVVPYGVDPDMLQKGVIVVYRGAFSQVTGRPRVPDEEIAKLYKSGKLVIPAGTR